MILRLIFFRAKFWMASRELEMDFDVGSHMTAAYSSICLTSICRK